MSQYTDVDLLFDGIDLSSDETFQQAMRYAMASTSARLSPLPTTSDSDYNTFPDSYGYSTPSSLFSRGLPPSTEGTPGQGFDMSFFNNEPVIPNTVDPRQLQFGYEQNLTYSEQPVYPFQHAYSYPNPPLAYPNYGTSDGIPTYSPMNFSPPELVGSISSASSSSSSPQNDAYRLPPPPTPPPAPQQFSSSSPRSISSTRSRPRYSTRKRPDRERNLENRQYPGLHRPLGGAFVCMAKDCTQTFGTDLREVHLHYKEFHSDLPCEVRRRCPFPDCKATPKGSGDLRRHLYSMRHGDAVFHCPEEACERPATRRDALKRHLVNEHKISKRQADKKCTAVERALGIDRGRDVELWMPLGTA